MIDGRDECARCGHLRVVHGAPRYKRGMGCISTVKTDSARHHCSCPGFEERTELPNPAFTKEVLQAAMVPLYDVRVPLLGEEELPSVLPAVEDSSLALGDRVLFRTPLIRRRSVEEEPAHERVGGYSYRRRIHRRDWVRGEAKMWRQGIFIGKRTLQNGRYDFGGGDEQASLYDIEYVTAYLIAYDLHQKPVRVLEDDIKRL